MEIRCRLLDGLSGHEAALALLSEMYRDRTGQSMPELLRLPGGKPCFSRGGLHFSVSHTKRRVFCALSDRPVGIDAEELDREIDPRLAGKILSPTERTRYEAQPDKRLALLKLWVLKEAAVKLTGQGLRGYPNKTDFSPDDPRVTVRDNCLVAIMEFEDTQE